LVSNHSKRCFSSSKHPDKLLGPQPPKYDEYYKQSGWDMKLTTQTPFVPRRMREALSLPCHMPSWYAEGQIFFCKVYLS
jgi:hypothetical protein